MKGYLVVFLGAGIGGALWHGANVAAFRLLGPGFPYGTRWSTSRLAEHGPPCRWFAHKSDPGQSWRLFLTTGILGGFTTFSTFSLDATVLWERGQAALALTYVLSSVVFALLGFFAGLLLLRHLP